MSPPIMPSLLHETFVMLIRERPALAADFLRDLFGIAVPEHCSASLDHADFTQIAPVEYRADVAVLLTSGTKPVFGIVVEVQLAADPDKQWVWPLYLADLRARRRCSTCLLIATHDETVANWARKRIELGPGFHLVPVVLGPEAVPVVTDGERAHAKPELAVLSTLAHGKGEHGQAIAVAAIAAALGLDSDRATLYIDIILDAVGEAVRPMLEEIAMSTIPKLKRTELAVQVVEKYKKDLKTERDTGRVEGRAQALLAVLSARQIPVEEAQRARILDCRDDHLLDSWIRRAVFVASVDDLLNEK
ncbi:MAG: hypothetical protein V2A73_02555 [Pseudomonadota bacterium]